MNLSNTTLRFLEITLCDGTSSGATIIVFGNVIRAIKTINPATVVSLINYALDSQDTHSTNVIDKQCVIIIIAQMVAYKLCDDPYFV